MRTLFVVALGVVAACHSSDAVNADANYAGWSLEELSNEQGFSFRIPPFEVDPGTEVQNCYFVKVPDINNGAPVWIDHFKMAQNPGSHHLNIFRVKTITDLGPDLNSTPTDLGHGTVSYPATLVAGAADYAHSPCWLSANWADWPLVANDQNAELDNPYYDWQLPQDVATKLMPGELLMVQSHYVNSTDQKTVGGAQIGINFYSHIAATPAQELGTLFATQQHIRVCEHTPDVSYSGTCKLPGAVTVTAANGHFHKRGKEFDIYSWDGTTTTTPPASAMFYVSKDWNEPPMATGLDVPTQNGGGVFWTCSYHWEAPQYTTCDEVNAKDPLQQGDCCYTFGGNTDVGEHCNVFAYYYPSNGVDAFCN